MPTPPFESALAVDLESRFVFAPSFTRYDALIEGKALGTADAEDLQLLRNVVRKQDFNLAQFAQARKTGQTVGKRKFQQVKKATEAGLKKLIDQWDDQELDEKTFRKKATLFMRQAWRDVYLAGIRAGGAEPSNLKGNDDPMVLLGPGDDKWLKSAVKHEMRFFNKLLDAIVTNDYVMPIPRRVHMYMRALESFFDSARIISLPNNVIIHWVGPKDGNRCPSCDFLIAHSPYTTANLPTTPRSGMTLCLTNCRDWLYIRRVPPKKAAEVLDNATYKRSGLIKKLRKIKRTGHP